MKTTIDLPDDLLRDVKIRAVHEQRKLKDMVAILLRRGLEAASAEPAASRHRVRFPLVETAHPAAPDEEMTPERIAQVLLQQEAHDYFESLDGSV